MMIPGLRYDTEDAAVVASFTWSLDTSGYVKAHVPGSGKHGTRVYLHRIIMGAKSGEHVDHINGDRFDNRRANLRLVTNAQNLQNRRGPNPNSKTGVRGVTWDRANRRFQAQVTVQRINHFLGRFRTLWEAEAAAIAGRRRLMTHSSECARKVAR